MKLKKITNVWLLLIGFIIIWALVTDIFNLINPTFVPGPADIIKAYYEMRSQIIPGILTSVNITAIGLVIGLCLGIGMGLFMAYSKKFMDTAGPFMEFTRPVPVFAMIPLFMLWFGIGKLPQILLIALGVSGILGVETYEAIKNMPFVYIRAASNLGAGKNRIFRTIVLPYIFPHLIGAIRVAAATSWGLDVAAEFMGVQTGLGYMMIIQQMYINTPAIIAIVIIYSILAVSVDKVFAVIQKSTTKWTDRQSISFDGIG